MNIKIIINLASAIIHNGKCDIEIWWYIRIVKDNIQKLSDCKITLKTNKRMLDSYVIIALCMLVKPGYFHHRWQSLEVTKSSSSDEY